MSHQMNAPMQETADRRMAEQGQMGQEWGSGELRSTEPRWDESRYSMPPEMGQEMQPGWGMNGMQQGWGQGMPPQGMGGTGMPGGASSAFEQSQRMKNPVGMEATHSPANSGEAYQASLRSLLARNVGFFIVATFLTGTQRMVTWQGILHTVGSDYIVIYQPDYERYISCDFYALKFVQFHNTRNTPFCASSHTWMAQDT